MEVSVYDPLVRIEGEVAYIPLGKGKRKHRMYAKVDVSELERVMRHKWYAVAAGKTFYARATTLATGLPRHHNHLHLFIMRAKYGERVDHANGDGLDCRKENLRPATAQQNAFNTFKWSSPSYTSRFKGVHRSASSGKWIAQIQFGGEVKCLGLFEDEEAAARAYDGQAKLLFGEFAKTNEAMGLFEGVTVNRNVDHNAFTKPAAPPEIIPDKRQDWERARAPKRATKYSVPGNIDAINREIAIRAAVAGIKCPRKRRKEASRLRHEANQLESAA